MIYINTEKDSLIVPPLAPTPQKNHASDRPFFKNSFDSERYGYAMPQEFS